MIRTIKVVNDLNESLTLDMANLEKSGLAIKSITGLGPSDANINITELVTSDVSLFNSARINKRSIVIKFLYCGSGEIEDSRLLTYKYFPIKRKITLYFETDNRTVKCEGYVEKNEQDMFTKTAGCTITINCPDPFFYAAGTSAEMESFTGLEKKFHFPFCNNSLTEKKLEFASIPKFPEQNIVFEGDYSTGLIINIYATNNVEMPTFYSITDGISMSINTDKLKELTGSVIISGDRISINTSKGRKGVTLTRDGKTTNIIACLTSFTNWFELRKGINKFTYSALTGGENLRINYEFAVAYEGV